jgi:uncharacterized protein
MAQDTINAELFSILACPKCRSDLVYNDTKTKLVCTKCRKEYEIKEGIPILMVK